MSVIIYVYKYIDAQNYKTQGLSCISLEVGAHRRTRDIQKNHIPTMIFYYKFGDRKILNP